MQLTIIGVVFIVGLAFLLAHIIWSKPTLSWAVLMLFLIELIRLVPAGK